MTEHTEYMSILKRWKDKRIVKVVTGIRRCGKSTLLKMFQEYLANSGVAPSQVQAINLEDIDNEPFLDYHTLYRHVKKNLLEDKMNYLFFRERLQPCLPEDTWKSASCLFLSANSSKPYHHHLSAVRMPIANM